MTLNGISRARPVREGGKRRFWITALFILLVVALGITAFVKNRGLGIEVESNRIKVTLELAAQPIPSVSTHSDASPIVTASGAHVETKVMGAIKPTSSQEPSTSGMSTTGAASPIVTGQGAVVISTVDNRP